jgi:bacteriocin leader peptide (microcyclamide/patellamide family)
MGKKNIKPQQQQPIIRQTTAKSITDGLTEENLTGYAQGASWAIPSWSATNVRCSFDGDDAE